jgi:hypothetical protein
MNRLMAVRVYQELARSGLAPGPLWGEELPAVEQLRLFEAQP